jgi:hypothetical protein
MKLRTKDKRHKAFVLAILLGAGISIGGCAATTGIQRSEDVTTTMQAMDNSIKRVVVQLDATGASLNELTKPGQSDVKRAFDLYSKNLSELEKMETDFAKNADEMKARGQTYFKEWQKEGNQYKDSQIQELSDQRRRQLGNIYDDIALNSIGVKDDFKAYVSKSRQIQHYLSNDLTTKGIEAISPIARKTAVDGENLNYAIKNIQTALERARAEMSQAGTTLYRQ